MRIQILFILLFIASVSILKSQDADSYSNGVVVTANPVASKVGIEILKSGGNAIDAAVAVHFALAVSYPTAGNIGGGGFMVYRDKNGKTDALDFREKAPSAARENMFLDEDGNPVEDLSLYSHLASGVPGSVEGMVEIHKKYGSLGWEKLLQPAIDLALNGFPLTENQANELNYLQDAFTEFNDYETAFHNANGWKPGDLLVQRDLGITLSEIRKHGRDGFYTGTTAQKIVDEMKKGKGMISADDLKNYQAVWREPVTGEYRDHKIISMPPPSSGGIALISLLQSVEQFPLEKWGFQQDSTIQVMVEAERRVYADRAEHLGDPDFYNVPRNELINREYNIERMKNISFEKASLSSEIRAGEFADNESKETTHYSIVDKEGNAVSITTTINWPYGNLVVVKGAGFILNNEMDDFSIKPGIPNAFGLIGGKANAIEPNKRMLSSMTPAIVEKDGKLLLIVGTPGGSTIITSVFQTILNVIDFGMNAKQAVGAPRFHHQWLPDLVTVEIEAVSKDVRLRLKDKGYELKDVGMIGMVEAVLVNPDGTYQAGADPRRDSKAEGY